jgi:hypothetical protein
MIFADEIFGGLLVGVAMAVPLLFEGRISGVSGYAESAMRPKSSDGLTGFIFVIGLILGGVVWRFSGGYLPDSSAIQLSLGVWVVAGLLVGFGSRLGGGCTSGHGVCGLGRLSHRSLISVVVFMAAAIGTAFLMRTFS